MYGHEEAEEGAGSDGTEFRRLRWNDDMPHTAGDVSSGRR
jgi:hypothetical protein